MVRATKIKDEIAALVEDYRKTQDKIPSFQKAVEFLIKEGLKLQGIN